MQGCHTVNMKVCLFYLYCIYCGLSIGFLKIVINFLVMERFEIRTSEKRRGAHPKYAVAFGMRSWLYR